MNVNISGNVKEIGTYYYSKMGNLLGKAIRNNEFSLMYQPQFDIGGGRVTGFEALLRWNSPELGPVSPNRFIPVAEETYLILPIGEWVLRRACTFIKKLHNQGHPDMTLSVNVSALQLLSDSFNDMVLKVLDEVKLDPKYLELEITESILMESLEQCRSKLEILRAYGIKVALDDFGKGYSSLNYLRQLPITTLKIDKSFIDTLKSDEEEENILDLIIKIGKRMNLCVIAEGVEHPRQYDYLTKNHCDKIQGYLFYKPLSEGQILEHRSIFHREVSEQQKLRDA